MLAPPRAMPGPRGSDPSSAFFASGVKGGEGGEVPVPAASVNWRTASRAGSDSTPDRGQRPRRDAASLRHQAQQNVLGADVRTGLRRPASSCARTSTLARAIGEAFEHASSVTPRPAAPRRPRRNPLRPAPRATPPAGPHSPPTDPPVSRTRSRSPGGTHSGPGPRHVVAVPAQFTSPGSAAAYPRHRSRSGA